ncbi:MAG: histidine kinase [Bacteroidales bacterium]|nr:histidine kinase [Bacteroidales bacterium]
MSRKNGTRNLTWLLHIAIWAVLFSTPLFSPRPGHPLHGGVDYARFIPSFVSFLIVFYANYLFLIKKYLYKKNFWMYILWNVLLIAAVSLLVHFSFKYFSPMGPEGQIPPGARPMPGPGPRRGPMPHEPGMPHKEIFDKIGFIGRNTMIYIGIVSVAIALKMTERWYKDERKRKEMEKATAEAELAALKSQVNPHFLFNTLNNIYSLIQIDQEKAQEAVHDLSGLMRHVLYESERPTVSMASETAFLQDYVKLMSMRCSPEVRLEVNLPEAPSERQIAPMLFLPLVENAFKHGIADGKESFIKIDLREDEDCVTCLVENSNHPKDDKDRSGSGIGIKNLCRRLEMIYPGNYSFEYGKIQDIYRCLLKIGTGNPDTSKS